MSSTGGLTRRRGAAAGSSGGINNGAASEDGERSQSPAGPSSRPAGGETGYTTSENGHKIGEAPVGGCEGWVGLRGHGS